MALMLCIIVYLFHVFISFTSFDHKDLNYTDGFIIQPAENDKARTVIVVCRQANEEQLVKIYFSDPQRVSSLYYVILYTVNLNQV